MANLPTIEVKCENHGTVAKVTSMANALLQKAAHLGVNKQCFGKVSIEPIDMGKEGNPPPK